MSEDIKVTDGTVLESLNNKADRDLLNLTEEGEKHFLNKSQITNCILEVPQRIKLELKNGVLTLKTGSCLIIPNGKNNDGSLKFDELITSKDYSWAYSGTAVGEGVPIGLDDGGGVYGLWARPTNVFSGTSEPSTGSVWYDTTNNIIKHRANNTAAWTTTDASGNKYFLPFCIFTSASNAIDSVKKVFNGVGYIGSSFWFDKGVKVLIPNGRNTDGTLKNNEYTLDSVRINTFDSNFTSYAPIGLATWGAFYWGPQTYIGGERPSNPLNYTRWYNEEENWWYEYINGWNKQTTCPTGYAIVEKGVIKEWNTNQPFRAVDYNEYSLAIDNKVSKAGDTMTGNLRIETNSGGVQVQGTGYKGIYTYSTDIDYTAVNQTNLQASVMSSYDKNNKCFAYNQHFIDGAGRVRNELRASRVINGTTYQAYLAFCVSATGVPEIFLNGHTLRAYLIQTYQNGTSGYNIWSNGYCEQWGRTGTGQGLKTVTLLKTFADTNYSILTTGMLDHSTDNGWDYVSNITTSTFDIYQQAGGNMWRACGYLASGQY